MFTKKAQKAPSKLYYITQTLNANIIDIIINTNNSINQDVNKMLTKKAPYECKI